MREIKIVREAGRPAGQKIGLSFEREKQEITAITVDTIFFHYDT